MSSMSPKVQNQIAQLQQVQQQLQTILSQKAQYEIEIRETRRANEELADLQVLCEGVRDTFTAQWNAALKDLRPSAQPSRDAFAETGDLLLLNYPAALHEPERTALLPPHTFLGSAVRDRAHGALTAATEYGYEHDAARVLDTLRAYLDETDETDESAAGAS